MYQEKINEQERLTTSQEVLIYYNRARRASQPWHDQIQNWRNLYNRDHYSTPAKSGEERYNDPTPTNVVDLAVGIILGNSLVFQAFGWGPDKKEFQDTDKIEKYLQGTLQINSEREDMNLPYEVTLAMVRDGCACLYSPWDPVLADRYLTRGSVIDPNSGRQVEVDVYKETPIRVQVVDPLEIYVLPGWQGRWLQIMRVVQMSVYDVEKMYGVRIKKYLHLPVTARMATKGKMIDYWRKSDREEQMLDPNTNMPIYTAEGAPVLTGKVRPFIEHAILFEQQELLPLEEAVGYEDLPFTLGFYKPKNRNNPAEWTEGILGPLEESVRMMEKATNRRQRLITVFSSMPVVAKTQRDRAIQLDPGMGNLIQIGTDENISFGGWQGDPPDVNMQMNLFQDRISKSGFSDIMFGMGMSSRAAGYAVSMLADNDRIRLTQPVLQMQMFWQKWAKFILNQTATFANGAIVRCFGLMRGKQFYDQIFTKDLAEYNVRAILNPKFPNDQTRKHAMSTQVRGVLSEKTIMENYLDVEQPEDERKRRMIEMAENNPIMQQYAILNYLMDQASNENDQAAALTLQVMLKQMQGQGMPAPKGMGAPPSQPQAPAPEQLTGLQGPQGQPPPQAMGGVPPGQEGGAGPEENPFAVGMPTATKSTVQDVRMNAVPMMTRGLLF